MNTSDSYPNSVTSVDHIEHDIYAVPSEEDEPHTRHSHDAGEHEEESDDEKAAVERTNSGLEFGVASHSNAADEATNRSGGTA